MPLPIPNRNNTPEAKETPPVGLPALPPLDEVIPERKPKRKESDNEIRLRDRHSPLLDEVAVTEVDEDPSAEIDPKTGLKFKRLPKSEYDAEGNPILQVDIDTNNLNSSAEDFLAHLRVAPSKEELKKMREEYAAKRRAERAVSDEE